MAVDSKAAGQAGSVEYVDISPSPRILQVLGDIEFELWQCVAELADNSFDEFLSISRAGIEWEEFIVTVIPPTKAAPDAIEVRDTGRGMTLDDIRNAVRAGWTSNDQFDKLGLFGMGFNIATARLGGKATVLTKRKGDAEWVGVEIDLIAIARRGEFTVPTVTRPADDPSESGTRVIVSDLKSDYSDWLMRNALTLRKKLGDVYSHLLEHENFKLYVGGRPVEPRRNCLWDESRTVTRRRYGQNDEIASVLKIDKALPELAACGECRHWQAPDLDECAVCGSTDLAVRDRRITGWLGIQRYLSPTNFGIDFLRNGRKILMRDRRLFEWEDPNSDTGPVKEYPIELPANQGRIVGEIHVDHVPVNYQKNAFEYHGREWRAVVHAIRGEGPLRDRARKEYGYTTANDSPLARLYDGYRRNDPGLKYLTPGNGTAPIHEKARGWGKAFDRGEAEYLADEKWYEAAKLHDELVKRASMEGVGGGDEDQDGDGGDVLDELGLSDSGEAGADEQVDAGDDKPESEQERQERFRSAGVELASLSAEYSLPSVGTVDVKAYLVDGPPVTDQNGDRVPVYLSPRPRSQGFFAFVDAKHPVFRQFASDQADFVIFEVAHHLRTRSGGALPLSELVWRLKRRHLQDLRVDPNVLSTEARSLLRAILGAMADAVGEAAAELWDGLTDDQRKAIETNMVKSDGSLTVDAARESGEYLRHLPALLVPRVVGDMPELWLDGKVFETVYEGLSADNDEARRVVIGRLVSYLTDVALLTDAGSGDTAAELVRARHTLDLLSQVVVADVTSGD